MPETIFKFVRKYLAAFVVIPFLFSAMLLGMDSYFTSASPTRTIDVINGTIQSIHYYGKSSSYDYFVAFGDETAFVNDKQIRRVGSSVTVLRKNHMNGRVTYELAQ